MTWAVVALTVPPRLAALSIPGRHVAPPRSVIEREAAEKPRAAGAAGKAPIVRASAGAEVGTTLPSVRIGQQFRRLREVSFASLKIHPPQDDAPAAEQAAQHAAASATTRPSGCAGERAPPCCCTSCWAAQDGAGVGAESALAL